MKVLAYLMSILFIPSFLLRRFSVLDAFGIMLVLCMFGIVCVAFYRSVNKAQAFPQVEIEDG